MYRRRLNRVRDANEPQIVAALESIGAVIHRLNERGAPDLLVGYRASTWLLEVKLPLGAQGGTSHNCRSKGGILDFTREQAAWWTAWIAGGGDGYVVRQPWAAVALVTESLPHFDIATVCPVAMLFKMGRWTPGGDPGVNINPSPSPRSGRSQGR